MLKEQMWDLDAFIQMECPCYLLLNVSLRKTKGKNCPMSKTALHSFVLSVHVMIIIESADVWNDHVVLVYTPESGEI